MDESDLELRAQAQGLGFSSRAVGCMKIKAEFVAESGAARGAEESFAYTLQ